MDRQAYIEQRKLVSEIAGANIYGVYKDGRRKLYDTEQAAFHAAQQNGGVPFTMYLSPSSITLITKDRMRSVKRWRNKHNKT